MIKSTVAINSHPSSYNIIMYEMIIDNCIDVHKHVPS